MKLHQIRCLLAASLLSLPLMPVSAIARSEDDQALAAAIEQCDTCHAPQAKARSIAPVLNGLPDRYLDEQIENFLMGERGNSDTDHFTGQMLDQLTALSEQLLDRLTRHYARQERLASTETVVGDATAGEPLFEEQCAGCHTSAMGRFFTKSPPIDQLNGPYVLAQLQAFAEGRRGFSQPGKHKSRMVDVAQGLDEQQMLNVTAYLGTRVP